MKIVSLLFVVLATAGGCATTPKPISNESSNAIVEVETLPDNKKCVAQGRRTEAGKMFLPPLPDISELKVRPIGSDDQR